MGVRVSFLEAASQTPGGKPAGGVTLPSVAVQGSGTTGVVFVVHDDRVDRRAVRLGASSGDTVTVLSGVTAGEKIAVGDFTQLKDGIKVHIQPPSDGVASTP
jgi:hypothetical protein